MQSLALGYRNGLKQSAPGKENGNRVGKLDELCGGIVEGQTTEQHVRKTAPGCLTRGPSRDFAQAIRVRVCPDDQSAWLLLGRAISKNAITGTEVDVDFGK